MAAGNLTIISNPVFVAADHKRASKSTASDAGIHTRHFVWLWQLRKTPVARYRTSGYILRGNYRSNGNRICARKLKSSSKTSSSRLNC
jgi:hypothetical protein